MIRLVHVGDPTVVFLMDVNTKSQKSDLTPLKRESLISQGKAIAKEIRRKL